MHELYSRQELRTITSSDLDLECGKLSLQDTLCSPRELTCQFFFQNASISYLADTSYGQL